MWRKGTVWCGHKKLFNKVSLEQQHYVEHRKQQEHEKIIVSLISYKLQYIYIYIHVYKYIYILYHTVPTYSNYHHQTSSLINRKERIARILLTNKSRQQLHYNTDMSLPKTFDFKR